MLSLAEAAARVGKSKPTLQRAIKGGRLSATRDESGAYLIDPAELARVYPTSRAGLAAVPPAPTPAEEFAELTHLVAMLEARLALVTDERDYLRQRIEGFERTTNQTLSLLKDGRARRDDEPDDLWPDLDRPRRRSWLNRIFRP
jgi:excisionase family DNA binding protein